jgi:Zn-dependent protease
MSVNLNSEIEPQNESEVEVKSHAREFIEIAVSALVLALSFGLFFSGGLKGLSDTPRLLRMSLYSLLTVSLGFILHEMAHRYVARKLGYIATYAVWIPGMLLSVVTAFLSVIFAAPGAVVIRRKLLTYEPAEVEVKDIGKISVAGPITNIILTLLFLLLSYLYYLTGGLGVNSSRLSIILFLGVNINSIFALFNLIPFGPFDGYKIYKWDKIIWFVITLAAIGLFAFTELPVWSTDNLNSPRAPTSYKLYASSDSKYSFNYPSNWRLIQKDNDSESADEFGGCTEIKMFYEKYDYGMIGVAFFDLSKKYPAGMTTLDAVLQNYLQYEYKDLKTGWNLTKRQPVVSSTTRNEELHVIYELAFQNNTENKRQVFYTYLRNDRYVYRLIYSCDSKYYDLFLPAYDKLKISLQPK